MLLVGTKSGLFDLDLGTEVLVPDPIRAIGRAPDGAVCLLEDGGLLRVHPNGDLSPAGELVEADGQSVVGLEGGETLIGRQGARLAIVGAAGQRQLRSFEEVPGRADWENPANPTPDTRSLAVGDDGAMLVNIHVGGLWRSTDGGGSWTCVIEPPADVHQVSAGTDGTVAVAAAIGFGWSEDGGQTWRWSTEGLHASYCRAVALDDRKVLVSASTGPFTNQGALYRSSLGDRFERCQDGLPDWFDGNVDTGQVSFSHDRAALGTYNGSLWTSDDGGTTWNQALEALPAIVATHLVDATR